MKSSCFFSHSNIPAHAWASSANYKHTDVLAQGLPVTSAFDTDGRQGIQANESDSAALDDVQRVVLCEVADDDDVIAYVLLRLKRSVRLGT